MLTEFEQKYPRLFLKHKRITIANPNGELGHDGDCCIYAAFMPICTCGLHHSLQPITNGDIHTLYPKYYDEMEGIGIVETLMELHMSDKLWQTCEECKGKGGMGQIPCTDCNGKGVVLFKIPEPLTEEEIAEMFKKLRTALESIVKPTKKE